MVNLFFHNMINDLIGYAIHGVYYTLLLIWVAYKIKTIKLEHELKKREINTYSRVRHRDSGVSVVGLEFDSCERCRKLQGCKKLKSGQGEIGKADERPKAENKDLPLQHGSDEQKGRQP
jgi:hypothetical protein